MCSLDSDNTPKHLLDEKGLYLGAGVDDKVTLLPYNCRTKHHLMWTCDNGALRNQLGQYVEFGGPPHFCPETHKYSQNHGTMCCSELKRNDTDETIVYRHLCENEDSIIECPYPNSKCKSYGGKYI